jgi:hypothetical protein
MTVIPHPPYSPNLDPRDFSLFPGKKRQMKGKRFADVSQVEKKTLEVLNNISTEKFQKHFQKWQKNDGTSVLNQKENILKETRAVIV